MAIRIAVHESIESLATSWTAFEATAAGTAYQTHLWCLAWQDTIGRAKRVRPRIVVGTHADGTTAFLLPLQISRQFGLRTLEWLAISQGGYGYGLFEPSFLKSAPDWFTLHWPAVVAACGPVDVIDLANMPLTQHGHAHPLSAWFNSRCPDDSFVLDLAADYDRLYTARRSGDTRRHNRKRDAALTKAGQVSFGLPKQVADKHRVLSTRFLHQESRLAESGVRGIFGAAERAFLHRIADLERVESPLLLPYCLEIDGNIQSVMLGAQFGGTYYALISSLADTALRKYSPGDFALRRTLEACCAAGLHQFDFSTGTSAYKLAWADGRIDLHCITMAVTVRGMMAAAGRYGYTRLKRWAKQSEPVRASFFSLRRFSLRPAAVFS